MNLIENEVSMQKAQNTKMIKIIGVLMIVLIIIAVILVSYLTYQKSKELKFIINGEKKAISTDLFYFDDNGDVYISIKDLSRILQTNKIKAEYNNGSYKTVHNLSVFIFFIFVRLNLSPQLFLYYF